MCHVFVIMLSMRVCTMYGTYPLPIGMVTYCCDLQHVAVSPYNVTLNSSYLVDLLDLLDLIRRWVITRK